MEKSPPSKEYPHHPQVRAFVKER